MKLARSTIESIIIDRPGPTEEQPQGMCLDKGYDYEEVRDILHDFGFTAHIRARGEEAKALKREAGFKARRWVVERSFGWLSRNRRLSKDYERKVQTSETLIQIAMIRLLLARLNRGS